MPLLASLTSQAVTTFARLWTGVRPNWVGCRPEARRRIYFANHASHGDFVLIWTVLPAELRDRTRPIAAADYWLASPIRRFVANSVFRAVLIARQGEATDTPPLAVMTAALEAGDSLILFPEGTRNLTDEPLLRFRSGLFNLAVACPDAELVPVWINNLGRVLPKGEILPLPLLCAVTFGAPIAVQPGEDRIAFLERARAVLLDLGGKSPS